MRKGGSATRRGPLTQTSSARTLQHDREPLPFAPGEGRLCSLVPIGSQSATRYPIPQSETFQDFCCLGRCRLWCEPDLPRVSPLTTERPLAAASLTTDG
jgi:hypothetical protein